MFKEVLVGNLFFGAIIAIAAGVFWLVPIQPDTLMKWQTIFLLKIVLLLGWGNLKNNKASNP